MDKKSILILLFIFCAFTCFAQNKTVKLSLEGKKYDNLYLLAHLTNNEYAKVDGVSKDGYNWTFSVSDTISDKCRQYCFRSKKEQNIFIDLKTLYQNDTLTGNYINFDENEKLIEVKAKFDTAFICENKIYVEELDTTIVIQTWETNVFFVPFPKNKFQRELMLSPAFSVFYDKKNENKSYEDFLKEYSEKIKKNPNSLYYISSFASTPHFYKSKQDIENLYNLFSSKMKNSIWGQRAKKNFALVKLDSINEIVLPNPLTNENEKVIYDASKYTLLCFSASWCAPCRKKIPLLKEIYEKTKEKLNLVYITTEEISTIDKWNELMEKENIEWRKLWLTDKKLKEDWQIQGIPDYILVSPDEIAKKINLNDDKDVEVLYSIIK